MRTALARAGPFDFDFGVPELSQYEKRGAVAAEGWAAGGMSVGTTETQAPKSRRVKPAKPFCEAFPALDIFEVVRRWRDGSYVTEWTNETGLIVGHATLIHVLMDDVTFEYKFLGTVNIENVSRRATFNICRAYVSGFYKKPSFVCECQRASVRLYFVYGKWACRKCHDLVYLSNRLTPSGRSTLERDNLANKIADTPVTEQRTRQYHNAKRKLGRLERESVGTASEHLPAQLSFRSWPRWLGPGETPKTVINVDEPGYGWEPGQTTGFDLFRVEEPAYDPETGDDWLTVDLNTPVFNYPYDMIGNKLFWKDLDGWCQQFYAGQKALAVAALTKGLTRTAVAARIRRSAELEPLTIDPEWVAVELGSGPEGERELRGTLRCSGDPRLLMLAAGSNSEGAMLRAQLADGQITLVIRHEPGDEMAARVALDAARQDIGRQLLAQASYFQSYHDAVAADAREFAQQRWEAQRSDKVRGAVEIIALRPNGPHY